MAQEPDRRASTTSVFEGAVAWESPCVSYIYSPTNLHEAWKAIQGLPVDDERKAFEGITHLKGIFDLSQLRVAPQSLRCLTFGDFFNQSLEGITLPGILQSLTFGHHF